MKIIYKYSIQITDTQTLRIPSDAQILCVQMQGAQACLWALVDSDAPLFAPRYIRVIGTGHAIANPEVLRYIGTIQLHEGSLIFHVFEEIK